MSLIELFTKRTGYEPNLQTPETYCEKALYSKINLRNRRLVVLGDKLAAKKFTTGIIHSIPTLAIDPDSPKIYPVVAKVNNRSGSVSTIRNERQWKYFLSRIPSKPYGVEKGEWHYQKMTTHIFLEPVIGNFAEVKFFCFDGKVKYLYLVEPNKKTFFTLEGEPLAVQQKVNSKEFTPTKFPSSLPNVSDLIPDVERMAEGLPHVRVDLMITTDKVYLSEFTFFHFSGMLKFTPKQFDYDLGKAWILP